VRQHLPIHRMVEAGTRLLSRLRQGRRHGGLGLAGQNVKMLKTFTTLLLMSTASSQYQHRLPQHLLRAREAVMAYFRPLLNSVGLTEQQWRILRLLDDRGEMEAGMIADLACILPPSLTGILVRMEKAGLIHRGRDKVDSRRLIVSLSNEGRQLTHEVAPLSNACYQQIKAHFGEEKLELLIGLLSELEQLPAPQAVSEGRSLSMAQDD